MKGSEHFPVAALLAMTLLTPACTHRIGGGVKVLRIEEDTMYGLVLSASMGAADHEDGKQKSTLMGPSVGVEVNHNETTGAAGALELGVETHHNLTGELVWVHELNLDFRKRESRSQRGLNTAFGLGYMFNRSRVYNPREGCNHSEDRDSDRHYMLSVTTGIGRWDDDTGYSVQVSLDRFGTDNCGIFPGT